MIAKGQSIKRYLRYTYRQTAKCPTHREPYYHVTYFELFTYLWKKKLVTSTVAVDLTFD